MPRSTKEGMEMRKCLLLMFCAAAFVPQSVLAIAASQAWVADYVSNYVARTAAEVRAGTTVVSSNGYTVVTANGGTTNEMRLVVQDSTDAALLATNCTGAATARGITNGCTFVWNGAGAYVNPLGAISCTSTNFVYSGVGSFPTNGVDRFAGWFDVYGGLIQANTSFSITNGMAEVGL